MRALLCEGGPHLHAQLIEAGLVDELFVTHAPKLAGGEGPGLVAGLAEARAPRELEWLLRARTGELFARYRVEPDRTAGPCLGRRREVAPLLDPLLAAAEHPQDEDRAAQDRGERRSESCTLRTPSGVQ